MRSVHQCQRCLYTTEHPFGLTLDAEGVCSGCRTHGEKTWLDWSARAAMLPKRVSSILGRRKGRDYDCVVPVRGTPEHFKVLDLVINGLGLRPLVVAYNSQFNSIAGIENFDRLRDTFNVDLIHYTSNPRVYKKLVRESLVRLGSMRWPYLAGATQFPVQVAVERSIPLVIWPLHQPTEQTGVHSYTEEPEMSRRGRHEFDLMRHEPADLVTVESLVQPVEVEDLHYPTEQTLSRSGVRGLYLANYYPWDSRCYSEEMIERFGARAALNRRTFDSYDRIDDCTYMTVHDILKFARLGYSRVTDSLCREIRFGRVSRADARAIELHFQAEQAQAEVEQFCAWLGMKPNALDWFHRHLYTLHPAVAGAVPLTEAQQTFVAGFKTNAPPVWTTPNYVVFGKGLSV